MPKYNIFRIYKNSVQQLLAKISSVGLVETGRKVIQDYNLVFYPSTRPHAKEPSWAELYRDYMPDYTPKNLSHFSIFLVESEKYCYVVSMGKAHFYLREFCDPDFGINLAERIADDESVSLKSSQLFGGKKNKSIVTYGDSADLDYDSGESIQSLKCATCNHNLWGKTAIFGTSVQLTLDIIPDNLPEVVERIEAELLKNPRVKIPRNTQLRDQAKITELNKKLVELIQGSNAISPQSTEYSLSGIEFIFFHKCQYQFQFKKIKSDIFDELTMVGLREFLQRNAIDLFANVDNLKVVVSSDSETGYTKPLKYFLYYVDHDNYFLYEGFWHQFNQDYLDELLRRIDEKIQMTHDVNLSNTQYQSWFSQQPASRKIKYREFYFNAMRESEGYTNLDRQIEVLRQRYKIEKADLYNQETLYFVKIGDPKKLSYVIDQCVATVKVLQSKATIFEVDGVEVKPKKMCLWIILDRKNEITKMSEIDSLIFLIKLEEWRKICVEADFEPLIKIGYVVA